MRTWRELLVERMREKLHGRSASETDRQTDGQSERETIEREQNKPGKINQAK